MRTYARMTLADLIAALEAMASWECVRGVDPIVYSYRGYYERNAIVPDAQLVFNAHDLAKDLKAEIGKPVHGWKGGDYVVSENQLVYIVSDEGTTGPCLIGFEKNVADGVFEPILLAEDWHF